MRRYSIALMLFFIMGVLHGQDAHKLLMEADLLYKNEKYNEAESQYKDAEKTEANGQASYNLGNTYFKQDKLDEAIAQYEKGSRSQSPEVQYRSTYNKGIAQYKKQDYQGAMQSFKEAIKMRDDDQAKENYLKSKQMMQQQMQQQQQSQKQQDKNKEDKEQQDQEQQQQENQRNEDSNDEDKEQQNQQSESKDQQKGSDGKQQQNPQVKPDDNLDKDEVQKLLDIAEEAEKKVQEKLKRNDNKRPPEKDW